MISKNMMKMLKTPLTKEFEESPAGQKAAKQGREDFDRMYRRDEHLL